MQVSAQIAESVAAVQYAVKARPNPLHSLMDLWERDGVDEDEPGGEDSIMVSGLIGPQFFSDDQI